MSTLGNPKASSPQRRIVSESRTVENLSATSHSKSKILRLKSNVERHFSYQSQQFIDLQIDGLVESNYGHVMHSHSSLSQLSSDINVVNFSSEHIVNVHHEVNRRNDGAFYPQIKIHKVC
jgi:hypothetical protein